MEKLGMEEGEKVSEEIFDEDFALDDDDGIPNQKRRKVAPTEKRDYDQEVSHGPIPVPPEEFEELVGGC